MAESVSEFRMPVSAETLDTLREIVDELVGRFGMTRADGVARVNQAWGDLDLATGPDLLGHEDPEYWASVLHDATTIPGPDHRPA